MTREEVQAIVQLQAGDHLSLMNDHRISLKEVLIAPQKISVTVREVKRGKVKESSEDVWLVGRENAGDGYGIVMRERDRQFGLASTGYSQDKHLVLVGWYGALESAFSGM